MLLQMQPYLELKEWILVGSFRFTAYQPFLGYLMPIPVYTQVLNLYDLWTNRS